MNKLFIYELLCPKTGVVRYIGKAKDPHRRYKKHLQDSACMKSHANRWIASLLRDGLKPELRVAIEFDESDNWQVLERACIALGFELGFPLVNTSAGGEGALILDPEVEARRIANAIAAWKNPELLERHRLKLTEIQNRPERREANRKRMKAQWQDPDYAALVSATVKAAYSTPEARRAQAERSRQAHKNPEVAARRSASMSASWEGEGVKERRVEAMKLGMNTPEHKERKARLMAERHKDPVFREKMRKIMADPEMIVRRGLAIKAALARKKAAKQSDSVYPSGDPESTRPERA